MSGTATTAELLEFATDAARQAGRLIMQHYQSPELRVDRKADTSEVTNADRGAEELLRELIERRFPSHGIIGEEFGESAGDGSHCWYLDPIDGTRPFVHGVPLFSTLIGLEIAGDPVLGVIYFPALDEMLCAVTGEGCTWNGRPARVSSTAELSHASVVYTEAGHLASQHAEAWARIRETTACQRGWGDAFGHYLVATGRAEVMLDPRLHPWDCAALIPVVREAGGEFLTWSGEPGSIHGGSGISTNGRVSLHGVIH